MSDDLTKQGYSMIIDRIIERGREEERMARLIDADALKKQWSMADKCEDCPQDARHCQFEQDFTRMDICEMLDDAPTVGGWISVKDRLPEETNCYLVHLINNYGIELDVYKLSDGKFHRCPGLVDYWMEIPPLPEPPEEVTVDGQG